MKRFTFNFKILFVIVGISVIAFGGATWYLGGSESAPKGSVSRVPLQRVPDLSFQDYNGNAISLADFKGKPMVVNAWAAWCPFCGKELQDFANIQKELGERVVIIAVDRAEPLDAAKGLTDKLGVTSDIIFVLDPSDSFYTAISGFSMPETIFVDSDGFIRQHRRGPMDVNEMRERIVRLIEQ